MTSSSRAMSDDTTLEEPDKEAIKLVCKLRVTWLHRRIVLFVTNDLFVFPFLCTCWSSHTENNP